MSQDSADNDNLQVFELLLPPVRKKTRTNLRRDSGLDVVAWLHANPNQADNARCMSKAWDRHKHNYSHAIQQYTQALMSLIIDRSVAQMTLTQGEALLLREYLLHILS